MNRVEASQLISKEIKTSYCLVDNYDQSRNVSIFSRIEYCQRILMGTNIRRPRESRFKLSVGFTKAGYLNHHVRYQKSHPPRSKP